MLNNLLYFIVKSKFRNAHFIDLRMCDVVKISFIERLINDYTEFLIAIFSQDVMVMTTRDWLFLFKAPLQAVFLPVITLIEHKEALAAYKTDCDMSYTTYSRFVLYWRSFDDFKTKPYRWNEI